MDTDRPAHTPPAITLASIHPAPSPQAVPLATAFIKAYAADCGCTIELADLFLGDPAEESCRRLTASNPAAIGFSMYVWNREACLETAGLIRNSHPGVLLFAGGPEATADPDGILQSGLFDHVILGEGELPGRELFSRIANSAPLDGIAGIATPDNPKPLPAPQTDNLDQLPSPYLSGILDPGSCPGILWQLSRGCGFACDFCFDARGSRTVRRFSLERIEAELRLFTARDVNQVFVLDSTFNQDMKRAKAILRLIRRLAPHIHFHFEVRSEFIDRELAELFAGITCSLQIGLQSAAPRVLARVGRSFRPDDFTARIGLLNEQGATFGFDLMFGLPGDSLQEFCKSIDYSLALYPNHLDIFPLAVLPGTALAMRSRQEGLVHLDTPPYTLIESAGFSRTDLARARRLAAACDIFYTRGRAVAWFNSVLDVLKLSASVFLGHFADWLDTQGLADIQEKELEDAAIKELQQAFLKRQFSPARLARYLPLVSDLVEYHYRYAVALLSPSCIGNKHPVSGKKLAGMPLTLSPSVQTAAFNYEILELLDAGVPDIPWMYGNLEPCGSHALIYPHDGTVCTESLAGCYCNLLLAMDGARTPRSVSAASGIDDDTLSDFLEFCWQEGIIRTPH